MTDRAIKVLVVDDNEKARDRLIGQLRFADVSVVGESSYGAAAFTWAEKLNVDLVVVAIEEPIARSLRTVESLAVGNQSWPVLGVSTMSDRETMRKAIIAGVRDHIVLPASDEELHQAITAVFRSEQNRQAAMAAGDTLGRIGSIIAVVGVKGGIGKSTIASNLAASLSEQTLQQVALVDTDLQFGDAALMLDIVPPRTIQDAINDLNGSEPQQIMGYVAEHPTRVRVLAAPKSPEGAEQVSADQVGKVLEMVAATHDLVVVDTSAQLDSVSIHVMDMATLLLLVVVPEVPCIRRTKAALDLMREWGYSTDKVKLIVNRSREKAEVSIKEIEMVLDYKVYAEIPEDPAAARAVSVGTPVVISAPKSESGRTMAELGRRLVGMPATKRRGLFRRRGPAALQPSEWDPNAPIARSRFAGARGSLRTIAGGAAEQSSQPKTQGTTLSASSIVENVTRRVGD